MTARENILARVREGLAAHPADDLRRARIEERMRARRRGTTPARARGDREALRALFTEMAREAGATVESVSAGEVPQRIAAFLRARNLGPEIRTGNDPFLKGLAWQQAPELAVSRGVADADAATGVSAAAAAAAETGTLVFTSGADNPTTVNFLPETHIAVIPASRIKATYEDAWDLVRRAHPPATLPRTVNFVTGPSRTADIEQTLLMGAHGPRRLHILVVADG